MTIDGEPAKVLLPFLQRADELQKHDHLVAYYCKFSLYSLPPNQARSVTVHIPIRLFLITSERIIVFVWMSNFGGAFALFVPREVSIFRGNWAVIWFVCCTVSVIAFAMRRVLWRMTSFWWWYMIDGIYEVLVSMFVWMSNSGALPYFFHRRKSDLEGIVLWFDSCIGRLVRLRLWCMGDVVDDQFWCPVWLMESGRCWFPWRVRSRKLSKLQL